MRFRNLLVGTTVLLISANQTLAQDSGGPAFSESGPVVFYLHGRVIEDEGTRPKHDRWGYYEYHEVVEALGSRGATVVSEARESGTNIYEYAGKVVKDVENAISAGVSPNRIAIVGFSKGGVIAIHVSSFLGRPDVRYAFLASCGDWINEYPHLRLTGDILSVVEESDNLAGSCNEFAKSKDEAKSYREELITTGLEHGVFYTPRSEWTDVVLDWVHLNDT